MDALPKWTPPDGTPGDANMLPPRSWNVYVNDNGQYRPAETLPDLFAALGWDTETPATQRARLSELTKMTSWAAAPAKLQAEGQRWLSKSP